MVIYDFVLSLVYESRMLSLCISSWSNHDTNFAMTFPPSRGWLLQLFWEAVRDLFSQGWLYKSNNRDFVVFSATQRSSDEFASYKYFDFVDSPYDWHYCAKSHYRGANLLNIKCFISVKLIILIFLCLFVQLTDVLVNLKSWILFFIEALDFLFFKLLKTYAYFCET